MYPRMHVYVCMFQALSISSDNGGPGDGKAITAACNAFLSVFPHIPHTTVQPSLHTSLHTCPLKRLYIRVRTCVGTTVIVAFARLSFL